MSDRHEKRRQSMADGLAKFTREMMVLTTIGTLGVIFIAYRITKRGERILEEAECV